MRHISVFVVTLLGLFLSSVSLAEGGQKHSIGMDFVRLIDKGQYEPNEGVINFLYQGSLTSRTAWQFGAATGDEATILDLGYKIYTGGYLQGAFWQLGLTYVDVKDSNTYDNDVGFTGQVGIEHSPAEQVTVSVGARMTLLLEHPSTGEKDPFFTPVVAVLYTF